MAGTDTTRTDTPSVEKLTFLTMAGMVVGSMVGAGVFSLPRRFAQETGVYGRWSPG
jgi:arginine:ornithine antiporter/lysine permease